MIDESARCALGVGDSQFIHFWCDVNITLKRVDVEDLDDRGIYQWKTAIGMLLQRPFDIIRDDLIAGIHANIIGQNNNEVPKRPLHTLYYEERDGVTIGMVYYENKSTCDDTQCFDLTRSPAGYIHITKVHNYGFLIETDSAHHAFIHNDSVYTILFFNPQNYDMHKIELPSYYACHNATPVNDITREILRSARARHLASKYFVDMNLLLQP